ncbi:hypothetical protein [Sedimenticola selenatireducens]|uniref:Uncharacterized protein n=1 Tax=Sedimenticola selenatireducens TaxID=191960 RepID=A0A557SES6_9GAMM|nr:hypothetical protein [Sedimenticola selenatireducens]TVO75894.1 hypothetical protein FHP88_07800 [Sedimenticola selenatireducens]TVT63753.1 MAG: hypothetical protein FHK78_10500 [Sedimenticola selenatireducens]
MTKKLSERRFPTVLADQVSRALSGVRDLEPDYVLELLAIWRRNRTRYIAAVGVTVLYSVPEKANYNPLPFPLEHYDRISALAEAFEALNNYNNGGHVDYASAKVNSALNKERASKPRSGSKKFFEKEFIQYLERRSYHKSDNKQEIMLAALERFGIKESTFYRAIKSNKKDDNAS